MKTIHEEEWEQWLNLRETKEFFELLSIRREELKERMIRRGNLDNDMDYVRGYAAAIEDIVDSDATDWSDLSVE